MSRTRLNNRDLTLYESGDGGDLFFKNGDLSVTAHLLNQPYLARHAGDDNFWGNKLFFANRPNKQFLSELSEVLKKVAINTAGRQKILRAAQRDVEYLAEIADITTTVTITGIDRIRIDDKFGKPEGVISTTWDVAKGEIIEQRFLARSGSLFLIDPDGDFVVDPDGNKIRLF